MLNVRNVLNDAERAKDKKAPIGVDVTIENFSDEIIDGIDLLDDLDDGFLIVFIEICIKICYA